MQIRFNAILALATGAMLGVGSLAQAAGDQRDAIVGSWRSIDGIPYGQVEILRFGPVESSGRGPFARELQDRDGNAFKQGSFAGSYSLKRTFLASKPQLQFDYTQDPWGHKIQVVYLDLANDHNLVIEDVATGAKISYRRER